MERRGIDQNADQCIPSNTNPVPHLGGEHVSLPPEGLTLERLEELMASRNDGRFVPFPQDFYTQCQDLVRKYIRFTEIGIEQDILKALTAFPPALKAKGNTPSSETTLRRQAEYEISFAEAAKSLARQLLERADSQAPSVMIPIWRAGLVFLSVEGVDKLAVFHIGATRDPSSLQTSFYYTSNAQLTAEQRLLICDPMVGTGNTIISAIDLLQERIQGFQNEQVVVIAMFSTPEGSARLLRRYPGIALLTASMDTHLDENAWIIHNDPSLFLGDFGDLLRARVVTPSQASEMYKKGAISLEGLRALMSRLSA
ncbi:MAG: hypothetical protein D6808_02225 [Candidatus Dadabacteria bacterium]|nr:MAG: hypothetical protein D6808_02225 [Candidatus Dadabacteria bacterium]